MNIIFVSWETKIVFVKFKNSINSKQLQYHNQQQQQYLRQIISDDGLCVTQFKVQRYHEKMTKIVNFSFTRHTTECQYFLMKFAVDELQTVLYKVEKFRQDQT